MALTAAANARQSSITLAPEAATQRMRDIICKTITDEMIESAIEAAFRAGYTSLKMYFMIGLPRETHAEVQGIVDLGIRAREIGRQGAAAASRCTSARRTSCPSRTRRSSGRAWRAATSSTPSRRYMRRATPDAADPALAARPAHLDAGGCAGAWRRATPAEVIERAWRAGARFDAWTEMFQEQAWHDAFAAGGHDDGRARPTATFGEWDELPWDHVTSGVSKEFLLDEWWQSQAEMRDWRLPLGRLRGLRRLLRPRPKPARPLTGRSRCTRDCLYSAGEESLPIRPGAAALNAAVAAEAPRVHTILNIEPTL